VCEPCLGTPETALSVEALQVRFEVHVEPFDAVIPGHLDRAPHQPFADAATTRIRMYGYVEQESMGPSIPGQIGESDEGLLEISTDESQTAAKDGVEVDP
jgi:hypothetical protein